MLITNEPFYSCDSEVSLGSSDSSCSTISSRTDGLLWDLEHNIHDGFSLEDFVEHVYHVKPEHLSLILSQNWTLEPSELSQYQSTLDTHATEENMRSAFGALVSKLARKSHALNGGEFHPEVLQEHLASTFLTALTPETISVPPLDGTFSLDLEDVSDDGKLGIDLCEKGELPLYPKPITSEDLRIIAHAVEAFRAPGSLYTTSVSVHKFSATLWYFDRSCIIRTTTFDFRQEVAGFALFAHAVSSCRALPRSPLRARQPRQMSDASCDDEVLTGALKDARFALPQHPTVNFMIGENIYAYNTLIGRGTLVYHVIIGRPEDTTDNEQVLKISWPAAARPREATLIASIVAAVPRWKDHLPQVLLSSTHSPKQLNFPRLRLLKHPMEDRDLHVLVMSKYQNLWEVDDAEEFQQVFTDCVQCHYHAYHEGKVLHRDLSENNVMFKRYASGAKGIVNDWDMASSVDAKGDVLLNTVNPTGTIPFMACDLLDTEPLPHLYRHDLESFMYILVWAAVHYDFGTRTKRPLDPALRGWTNKNRRFVRQAKRDFLFSQQGSSAIYSRITGDSRQLITKWIEPLRALFATAMSSATTGGLRTYDGRITFHTFMEALGSPR